MSGYGIKRGEGKFSPIIINKDNAISRGRFINKLEYRKTDKAEFLLVEIIDKFGNTARRTYFPPKLGLYIKDAEQLKKEENKFNRTMENLTKVLLSSSYETGEVATFEEFCKKIIADIGKSYYNRELRVKLVYDSKNRPTLPNYPIMFEDPSIISDDLTKMKLTQWDKVEPTEVKMDSDPVEVKPSVSKDPFGDLPF